MQPPEPDYYAGLELSQPATQTEIKKAYRRLAIIHHPDKKAPGQDIDAAEFRKIQSAYEFLGDASRRAGYDLRYAGVQRNWDRYRQWQRAEEVKRARDEELKRAADKVTKARAEKEVRDRLVDEIWRRAEKAWRQEEARKTRSEEQVRQARAEEKARRAAEAREVRRRRTEERTRRRAEEQTRKRAEEEARKKAEEEAREREEEETRRRAEEQARRAEAQEEAEFARQQNPFALACLHPDIGKMHWQNGMADCTFCHFRTFCYWCPSCNIAACRTCRAKLPR
ncbi:hypothetical protein NKR19_g5365 [Coniochaeta hoffmannii]|uniref:J domain-containing protein n=1 Tax=Coniochaeta hoffmannii TaxID=91930 RepID=A0AA38S6A3_9PEZI|nr:hypothetical protein NKR19_g5365 [Coniochaeta hoffmannii]